MGRYYNGDIEGKFWFAVQSSNAADRFGQMGEHSDSLNYYYGKEHLETVQNELKNIEETLGDELKRFEDFFKKNNGYNDDMLKKEKISELLLEDYADYLLGKKIEECIIKNDKCFFEAEL